MWPIFILIHLVGLVGYNLLLRKTLVAQVDKLTVATVMQTGIAIPLLFVLPFSHPNLHAYNATTLAQVLLTVGLVIALHLSNVKALQYLEAGVYSILYNLRIIFTTILGIVFLHEKVIPLQILGGLFIFLGVLTLKQKDHASLPARGLQWGLTAGVVISVLNVFEKTLINTIGYINYAVPVMILAAIIMWAVLLAQHKRIKFAYFKEPNTLLLMIFRAMSAFGFTLAFNASAVLSVATYISSLSVIIIVLLGVWLLGERNHIKQKLAAAALAVIGLTTILIANL